jgi:anhydro-N-acetylmuramic acid kinase
MGGLLFGSDFVDRRLGARADDLLPSPLNDAAAAAADAVDVDLICSHGQTVFHWVDGQQALGTLQIGQPAWIAERTGRPVVHDVRSRDVAAGGQGAPLVSVLDTLVLGGVPGHPAALNLGGIANMTVLRPGADGDAPVAYDIGPANALIDAAVLRTGAHPAGFDVDGRIAARGRVVDALLAQLLDEAYYDLPAPKSTGKELFHDRYLDEALREFGAPVADDDLIATLTALTARTVADQVTRFGVDRLVASGGGAANRTMLAMLRAELTGVDVVTSDAFGAPISEKEAIAFALIGWLTVHGLPATVPSCTGATGARILGSVVPGAGPLVLPSPVAVPPRALHLAAAPEVTA